MIGLWSKRWLRMASVVAAAVSLSAGTWSADGRRLSVAVTESDIEAVVKAVGGNQVDTFSLFKGCILRKDLAVESPVRARLAMCDSVVWTGYLNESAAISAVLREQASGQTRAERPVPWIDVSKGATRVNVPTSVCDGYVDPSLMVGNPFFWLNPQNGGVIARNVAEGLGDLRPAKRAYFMANASTFEAALDRDIARWKEELKPLTNLRVFCTQCGWQNFSQLGGPTFVVCKGTPGVLPTPAILVDHVKEMKAQVVLLDPNTPPEYGRAFRQQTGLTVVEVASSVEDIPGAKTYGALFDNLVKTLKDAAAKR